jgi:hypothetical protein
MARGTNRCPRDAEKKTWQIKRPESEKLETYFGCKTRSKTYRVGRMVHLECFGAFPIADATAGNVL